MRWTKWFSQPVTGVFSYLTKNPFWRRIMEGAVGSAIGAYLVIAFKAFVGILFVSSLILGPIIGWDSKQPETTALFAGAWTDKDKKYVLFTPSGKPWYELHLHGRPEGALGIILEHDDDLPDRNENLFQGEVYCLDHLGTTGRVLLTREPQNAIRIRVLCDGPAHNSFEIELRRSWPTEENENAEFIAIP
ncbi:hypothetical protein Pan97_20630 [Bremerella volcania]|uniref:Uncharacterized protein n=1 Tax=Bremerella volcania TaxID=2527984 RepID=A0A518C768_9BACT|nr:hypothetical protein [Bremerella volcania]QDU75042.1 hypothetical protein Pan97_20630 [Bremerella volcania]